MPTRATAQLLVTTLEGRLRLLEGETGARDLDCEISSGTTAGSDAGCVVTVPALEVDDPAFLRFRESVKKIVADFERDEGLTVDSVKTKWTVADPPERWMKCYFSR